MGSLPHSNKHRSTECILDQTQRVVNQSKSCWMSPPLVQHPNTASLAPWNRCHVCSKEAKNLAFEIQRTTENWNKPGITAENNIRQNSSSQEPQHTYVKMTTEPAEVSWWDAGKPGDYLDNNSHTHLLVFLSSAVTAGQSSLNDMDATY